MIRLVCILIFTQQIYLLSVNYFQFNVSNDVSHYYSDEIEIPVIQISFPFQNVISIEQLLGEKSRRQISKFCDMILKEKYSDPYQCKLHEKEPTIFSKIVGNGLSLGQIKNYSYPTEMFLKRVWSPQIDLNLITSNFCKILRGASASAFVISLVCTDADGNLFKVSRRKAIVIHDNLLFGFILNATPIAIRLVHRNKTFTDNIDSLDNLELDLGSKSALTRTITWIRKDVYLLPSTYSNCAQYNRQETFNNCLNENSLRLLGKLYPGPVVSLDKYREDLHFQPIREQPDILMSIYDECQSLIVKPMCHQVYYPLKVGLMQKTKLVSNQSSWRFLMKVSPEPYSKSQSKLDLPLHDFIILAGSLFSTWFGVSIMGQLIATCRLLEIIFMNRVSGQNNESS